MERSDHPESELVQRCRKLASQVAGVSDECRRTLDEAADYIADNDVLFDLRWASDMRAISHWHKSHPGTELIWPDHTELLIWLLDQLEAKPATAAA